TVHPLLKQGTHFARTRSWPARAPILAADGTTQLAGLGQVVSVGLHPSHVTDRAHLLDVLNKQLGIAPATVNAILDRPGLPPEQFVPLSDLRLDRFAQLRPILDPVGGIVFRKHDARLPISEGFGPQTLGRAGDITAELLAQFG